MNSRGKLESITKPILGKGYIVTLRMDTLPVDLENKDLDIEIKVHRERRSKDANALLWACIGDIARAITQEPWGVYLSLLKRYGKYTYIVLKPEAVQATSSESFPSFRPNHFL